jgi:shikimate dehydrogenase
LKKSQPSISSVTGVFGVIGDPIEHSLSPVLHNHVLERLGLDYRYLAFHVSGKNLSGLGLAFRTLGLRGLNVTIPHKEAVVPQMDELTVEARHMGAVNTIGLDESGKLVGHNTDAIGFFKSLEIRGLTNHLSSRPAVLLGAGGAARAVLCGLIKLGAAPIRIVNRTVQRAEELADWCGHFAPGSPVEIVPSEEDDAVSKAVEEAYITVNVTPLGMAPEIHYTPLPAGILPRSGTIVYDTIYNPLQTMLLERAEKNGCQVVSGLDMLIIQGMESLSWWLKQPVPWREMIDELRDLLHQELK